MKRVRLERAPYLFAFAALFAPAIARAEDAGADTNDVRALERQLNDEHAALSTADCNAACRALMSIRRAADKICALEPGPRCDAARSKAQDATKRVRDVCPDCIVAETQPERSPERSVTASADHNLEAAPRRSGGCGACAVSGSSDRGDLALMALGVLGVTLIGRRRTRKDRRPL